MNGLATELTYEQMRSPHAMIALAVGKRLAGSSLLTNSDYRVWVCEKWDPAVGERQAVVVSYELGTEIAKDGPTTADDFDYPVLVALRGIGPLNADPDCPILDVTAFRDWVRQLFHQRRIPDLATWVFTCRYVPQVMIEQNLRAYENLDTLVGVVASARLARGTI